LKVKITVAKYAGFCPGVNDAIKRAIELSKRTKKRIYTLGPLIHNKDVIKNLEEKNIYSVESIDEIKDIKNSVLVIRAHGIPPQTERKIIESGIEYIDATCPLVKRVHRIIEKYEKLGYTTIILGDPNHAEVIGLKGYAKNPYIITSEKDALNLPFIEKANLVSQTTQEVDLFEKVAEILKTKVGELVINNTICQPTRQKQKETIREAQKAELVIVIGGKHSANTWRLYQISKGISKNAILIENENELDISLLNQINTIFVTAGASTPMWLVERVVKKIKEITARKNPIIKSLEFIVGCGILTLFCAFSLLVYIYKSLNVKIDLCQSLSLSLIIVAAYIINRKNEAKRAKTEDNIKKTIFIKYHKHLTFLLYFFILTSYTIALVKSNYTIAILISFFIIPSFFYNQIKKIIITRGLKDTITAVGWSYILGIIPSLNLKIPLYLKISIPVLVFAISLERNILISLVAKRNDIILTDTLINDFGEKKTSYLFYILSFVLLLYPLLKPFKINILIIPLFYAILFILIKMKKNPDILFYETLIDLPFILLLFSFLIFR
jgi:(E)-4-hydroxy-3-methyl-but-2-enyl pyrophosphate reductase